MNRRPYRKLWRIYPSDLVLVVAAAATVGAGYLLMAYLANMVYPR